MISITIFWSKFKAEW